MQIAYGCTSHEITQLEIGIMWLINILGIAVMACIVWWFWLWKPRAISGMTNKRQIIIVDSGTYQPAHISVPVGRPSIIHFLRKDPSPCASTVIFPAWDISAELPVDEEVAITIQPSSTGVYPFTCQMQMYRGEVHVVGDEN
jgi:plastocyanin domain-containing protein